MNALSASLLGATLGFASIVSAQPRFGIGPAPVGGPWTAAELKGRAATTALEEARASFEFLNRYASQLLAWRLDRAYRDNFNVRDSEIARHALWGPWTRLRRDLERRPSKLVFGSERREPGSFQIDGQVRVAKTGSQAGSPIHVNEDLIVREGPDGQPEPIGWLEIAAILVHEHGHHLEAYGLKPTHAELDAHGAEVRNFLEGGTRVYEYGALPPEPDLPRAQRPTVIVTGHRLMAPARFCDTRLLFVRDAEFLYDLSKLVDTPSNCREDGGFDPFAPRHFAGFLTTLKGFVAAGAGLKAEINGMHSYSPYSRLGLNFAPRAGGGFLLKDVQ